MSFIPFNSRDIRHKSIFGSTAAGETLWLSVCMPRDMGCTGVYFVVGVDGGDRQYISMDWKSTDGVTEWWSLEYDFPEAELYYYHFEYDTPWGRGRIFLHSSGMGQFSDSGNEWQQTVYSPKFETPAWFRGGVMYQIFPDRFFSSGEKKENVPSDRTFHTDMNDIPAWKADKNSGRWNTDFFGGDLRGIEMKLPYLKTLGVTCIYLNPIFESHSNHRYDTADYMKIDPILGNEQDFVNLCKSAEKSGIKIILDGVFSHTGADSIYFNMYNRYSSEGAYNSEDSVYFSWYNFKHWNDDYDAWWGIKSLPETNEEDPGFSDFITGKKGVIDKWMNLGASGFRLDVADELPDSFIVKIRKAIKKAKSDGLLIGEVWEDASNKISHGGRRKYFEGEELDSVMNYPFRNAIIDFMKNGIAENFMETIVTICENYPPQVLSCLMNSLGTHDTERIFSVLGGLDGENHNRYWQKKAKLTKEQRKVSERRLKVAVVIQYTLPGVPCIYYGDELLTEGLKDPFNRTFFPWDKPKTNLQEELEFLGEIRNKYHCLKNGRFLPVSAMLGCAAYERISAVDRILVIVNKNPHDITYYLPEKWHGATCITGQKTTEFSVELPAETAVILDY